MTLGSPAVTAPIVSPVVLLLSESYIVWCGNCVGYQYNINSINNIWTFYNTNGTKEKPNILLFFFFLVMVLYILLRFTTSNYLIGILKIILLENRNGHLNTELETWKHLIWQYGPTRTPLRQVKQIGANSDVPEW
jgi:hypothetical protein